MEDKTLHELYNLEKETDSFIADASRRRIEKDLKQHNFLTFNTNQFNVFYLAAGLLLGLLVVFIFVSDKLTSNQAPVQIERKAPEPKPEPKPEVKPEPKKIEAVTAVSDTVIKSNDSLQTKVAEDVLVQENQAQLPDTLPFAGLTEVTGRIFVFEIPQKVFDTPNWLPAIPDSLPVQKVTPKPIKKKVIPVDTVKVPVKDTAIQAGKTIDTIPANNAPVSEKTVEKKDSVQTIKTPEPTEAKEPSVSSSEPMQTDTVSAESDQNKRRRRKDK